MGSTQKRDYYEVLSVERSATVDEIKKAYRQAALRLHPDRNPGDADAEEKFKEATEAYTVLSDAEKRALYDRLGHAGMEGFGFDDFPNMRDVFSHVQEMFGDFFGVSPTGPQKGGDVRATVRLTLREAVFGTKKDVKVAHVAGCEACEGTGAADGKLEECPSCQGRGQVAHARGAFILSTTCPKCGGDGRVIVTPCAQCDGRGETVQQRTVKIGVPAGVDDGQTLRLAGKGQPGLRGGASGHLYVTVEVEEDPRFQRDGQDLIHEVEVPFPDAVLGGEIEIETLDGETVKLKIPAGIPSGDAVPIKGRGVPRLDGRGRGDLIALVRIAVPKKLSPRAKKLLEELSAELRGEAGPADQGGGGKSRRKGGKRPSSSQE